MYAAYLIETEGNTVIADYDTLEEALHDIRQSWNEDPTGPQAFMVTRQDIPVAFLMRPEHDPEVCITTHTHGTTERHRCTYAFGADGGYVGTAITAETTVAIA